MSNTNTKVLTAEGFLDQAMFQGEAYYDKATFEGDVSCDAYYNLAQMDLFPKAEKNTPLD